MFLTPRVILSIIAERFLRAPLGTIFLAVLGIVSGLLDGAQQLVGALADFEHNRYDDAQWRREQRRKPRLVKP